MIDPNKHSPEHSPELLPESATLDPETGEDLSYCEYCDLFTDEPCYPNEVIGCPNYQEKMIEK
jgi:hypothetical protein